jgi:hypothetical protein
MAPGASTSFTAPACHQSDRLKQRHAIRACGLPADALLARYRGDGSYTDCYVTEVSRPVSQAEYVEAFYTSGVFKLERLILKLLVARPSTDQQARELASGQRASFAAWSVEARAPDQLLLCDFRGRTRSWLSTSGTRLYFGSAVIPVASRGSRKAGLGFAFRALLGFHRLYSRVLLQAAVRRLR